MTSVLSGTNWFGVKTHLDELVDDFVRKHGELAIERIDASESSQEVIRGSVESLPFLAARKLVIVHNLSENKEAAEKLDELIEMAGDITDLVIVETAPDKRSSYYKKLKKLKGFSEYNEPSETELIDWLIGAAKDRKAILSRGDASFLVQRVGSNQERLDQELLKLTQYSGNITRETINLLIDESPSSTVFNLLDRALAGDAKHALSLYDEQRLQKVEPQAIHGMLVWQMHAAAVCLRAPEGTSDNDIARESGLNPFVVKKSRNIAQRLGLSGVSQSLEILRDIDYKAKHQTFNYDSGLKFLILSLSK